MNTENILVISVIYFCPLCNLKTIGDIFLKQYEILGNGASVVCYSGKAARFVPQGHGFDPRLLKPLIWDVKPWSTFPFDLAITGM